MGFAQLARPALAAVLGPHEVPDSPLIWTIGAGALIVGGVILALGHHSMRPDEATFLYEYVSPPRVVTTGIYARLRHPMYLRAAVISFGVGVLAGGTALALGAINLATVAVYGPIEDQRLSRVLGPEFVRYRETVGRFLPRRRSSAGRSDDTPSHGK